MILKAATVKYYNALPFVHALNELAKESKIYLVEATPAVCAELLQNDTVDLALIPVGALSDFPNAHIVSDYCIACDGPVRTVKLFSQHAINEIQQIVLDSSSRSSNILIQVLCKNYWNSTNIDFVQNENCDSELKTGWLKIGDEVFNLEGQYNYEYDLGEAWKNLTGLPFVFAVWVSKRNLNKDESLLLNLHFRKALQHLQDIIAEYPAIQQINAESYFEKNIFYELDEPKRNGIKKFFELNGMPLHIHL